MKYPKAKIKTPAITIPSIVEIDPEKLINVDDVSSGRPYISRYECHELAGKGYYLDNNYDWIIVEDLNGSIVLLPLKQDDDY